MSIKVPMDQPLTPEHRQYLVTRGELDLIRRMDEEFPPAAVEEQADDEPDELETKWLAGGGPDAFKLSELQQLAQRRGLVDMGTKAELVARIEEHDSKSND